MLEYNEDETKRLLEMYVTPDVVTQRVEFLNSTKY